MFAVSYSRTQAGIKARRETEARIAAQIAQDNANRARREAEVIYLFPAMPEIEDTPEVAKPADTRPFTHTYEMIEKRACKLFKCTKAELRSHRRAVGIVFARQFIMYWAARLTNLSLPQIGRLMGGLDHTTILHGKSAYVKKRLAGGAYTEISNKVRLPSRKLRPAR